MDDQGFTQLAGSGDMGAKPRLLPFLAVMTIVVIQTGFANRDHASFTA